MSVSKTGKKSTAPTYCSPPPHFFPSLPPKIPSYSLGGNDCFIPHSVRARFICPKIMATDHEKQEDLLDLITSLVKLNVLVLELLSQCSAHSKTVLPRS